MMLVIGLVVGHLAVALAEPLKLGCTSKNQRVVGQGSIILLQSKSNDDLKNDANRTLLQTTVVLFNKKNESEVWCHHGIPNPRASWILTLFSIFLCITCVMGLWGTTVWLGRTLPKSEFPGFPLADQTVRCDALDGFRVLFTVHIIGYHHGSAFALSAHWKWFTGLDEVRIFFIMAGFVQTMVDYGRRPEYGGRDVAVHIARRLARLAPPYYAVILWEALIAIIYGNPEIDYYMPWTLNSLFLQTIIYPLRFCHATLACPKIYATYAIPLRSGHIWFVSAMLWTGLCHPLFYNLLRRRGLLVHGVMLAAAMCFILRYINDKEPLYFFAPPRMLQYIVGMLGALIASQIRSKYKEDIGNIVNGQTWGRLFDACFLVTLAFSRPQFFQYAFNHRNTHICDGVLLSGWTLLLVAGFCMTPGSSMLGQLLSAQPFQRLATYAYGAYLFQFDAQYILPLWPANGFCDSKYPEPALLSFVLANCVPWALAIISFHFLEVPVHRGVEKMLRNSGP